MKKRRNKWTLFTSREFFFLAGLIPRNTAENKIFIGFFVLKKLELNVACDSRGKANDFPSAMLLIGICLILFASIIKPTQRKIFFPVLFRITEPRTGIQ